MTDSFTNLQNDPYLSEPSEESKNRNSILSSNSKTDFYEQNLYTKIEALVFTLKSDLQSSLFHPKDFEYISKFQGNLEHKLDFIQKQLEDLHSSNQKHLNTQEILNKDYEMLVKTILNPFEQKFRNIEQKLENLSRSGNQGLSDDQKLIIENEILRRENKDLNRVIKKINEKYNHAAAARDKFTKLFYESSKKITELEKSSKAANKDKQEIIEELEKCSNTANKDKQSYEEIIEELEKDIGRLKKEKKELEVMVSEQEKEVEMLKKLKDFQGNDENQKKFKDFSEFLRKSGEQVNEVKHKLENLYFKIVEKVENLESENCEARIGAEVRKNSVMNERNREILVYLKDYTEIIQNQIEELEGLEMELDRPEGLDEVLRRMQERNLADERILVTETMTISSDDELR